MTQLKTLVPDENRNCIIAEPKIQKSKLYEEHFPFAHFYIMRFVITKNHREQANVKKHSVDSGRVFHLHQYVEPAVNRQPGFRRRLKSRTNMPSSNCFIWMDLIQNF